jgi:hypothetical protein
MVALLLPSNGESLTNLSGCIPVGEDVLLKVSLNKAK